MNECRPISAESQHNVHILPRFFSKTTEPIDKFGVGDNVGDDSPHTKTQNERPGKDVAAYA